MASSVLEALWTVSWQAAVLAGVVWGVCRVTRKAPAAWRCALWLVVLVKLFIPPMVQAPRQVAVLRDAAQVKLVGLLGSGGAAEGVGGSSSEGTVSGSVGSSVERGAVTAGGAVDSRVEPSVRAEKVVSTASVVVLLWLAGVGVMGFVLLARAMRQRRAERDSVPVGADIAALARECADRLGVRRVPEVRYCGAAATPMLVGVIRPRILLPGCIEEMCGSEDLKAMLLHELAHVKRWDMVSVWLAQVAGVVFFFNPVVWLVGRELAGEREVACDELVLAASGMAAKDYASGYVSALKLANLTRRHVVSLAMAEPFDLEKKRLQMILRREIPRLNIRWVVGLMVVVAAGLPTFAGFAAGGGRGESAVELITHLREARDHARLTIKSAKGSQTHVKVMDNHTRPDTHKFAFSGDRFFSVITVSMPPLSGTKRREYKISTVSDGRGVLYDMSGGRRMVFSANSSEGRHYIERARRIFDLVGQSYGTFATFRGMYGAAISGERVVGYEKVDGSECAILELTYSHPRDKDAERFDIRRIWIDVNRGYVIPRVQYWWRDGLMKKALLKETRAHFRQVDSVWVPKDFVLSEYKIDPKTGKRYCALVETIEYGSDLALNVAIPDEDTRISR